MKYGSTDDKSIICAKYSAPKITADEKRQRIMEKNAEDHARVRKTMCEDESQQIREKDAQAHTRDRNTTGEDERKQIRGQDA